MLREFSDPFRSSTFHSIFNLFHFSNSPYNSPPVSLSLSEMRLETDLVLFTSIVLILLLRSDQLESVSVNHTGMVAVEAGRRRCK